MVSTEVLPLLKSAVSEPNSAEVGILDSELRCVFPKIASERINFYLNLAVKSAKIRKITIHYPDGTIADFPRPMIHIFLSAQRGNLKSTRIDQVRKTHPDEIVLKDQVSFAALVGSIDKESKTYNVPLAIRADGKVLVLDEVVRDDKGHFTKALLQLTERGEYSRDVALTSKPTSLYDGRFVVKNGEITIKSRFSLIMVSMFTPGMIARSITGRALLDRMVVLYFNLSSEERKRIFNTGQLLYTDLGFNPPQEVDVSKEDYARIYEFWIANDSENLDIRRLGDLIRCFAVLGHHDEIAYAELIKLGSPKEYFAPMRRH